ncbi:MAG: hypothetical protein KKA05_01180 [Alphaproteobacteria bacterium]|nr:hypothetical protein [Alphaproteobacteria bacterium]MBU0858779.1 hypothetical protein [Alphaproteobacteria bacterium]
MNKKIAVIGLCLLMMTGLSACYLATGPLRHETAIRLASAAHMLERHIEVNGHDITVFERATQKNAPARLYIAGDGPLWLTGEQMVYEPMVSSNPTPVNPVALHLATHDNATNKFYVARPCQYLSGHRPDEQKGCPNSLWREGRYGPDVIEAVNGAIEDIKRRYQITEFQLVGFEGGGVIALALALRRDDVVSVRTVAAPLDHKVLTDTYKHPPFNGSVNAADFAQRLANLPQHHFFGHMEEQIPYKAMYDSYAAAAGSTRCMQFSEIKRASDDKGFVRNWPIFLKFPVDCKNP